MSYITYEIKRNILRDDMKNIWWNWFVCNRQYHSRGLTFAKLKKIKLVIFDNNDIWFDLFERHDFFQYFPWEAEEKHEFDYKHAIGNLNAMVTAIAIKKNLIIGK